ncbi:MAG: universal stress protein [Candidatus Obscuribacterales bacterium]|nr:universal stress protein [Candidatus Obscuribacterales bacterium]
MPFKKLLVALDGSEYSQIAANYAFWLANRLNASIDAQHVVDPRLADFFIAPEFAQELGLAASIETSDKVISGLRRVGELILELFSREAADRKLQFKTFLDEGYITQELLKRSANADLVIMGHRGKGHRKIPSDLLIGAVAERIAVSSKVPVLIAVQPIEMIGQALVAYDGSEPSRGALFMAENLAKNAGLRLRAMIVVPSAEHRAEAELLIEQAKSYLREEWPEEVFMVAEGPPAPTLMEYAASSNSLLVLGAYGFRTPEGNVIGSTTTHVVRMTQSSILIYR